MAQMQDGQSLREDRVRLRDAALDRISRTRRWLVVAAAGLTAGLAALVSAILPGKSLGAKSKAPAARTAPVTPVTPALPAPASADQLGVGASQGGSQPSISPPPAAPQPAAPAPQQSAPAPQQSAPAPQQSAPGPVPQPSAPAPAVSGGS